MAEGSTNNNAIEFYLRRHKYGVKLHVRVWPAVEEFFERWSGGATEQPGHGRTWRIIKDPIYLWAMGTSQMAPSNVRPYSLYHAGAGFFTESNHPNISWVRLVGASRPEGREIIFEVVIGKGELVTVAQRMTEACNMFYTEYLQPVNIKGFVGIHNLPPLQEAA